MRDRNGKGADRDKRLSRGPVGRRSGCAGLPAAWSYRRGAALARQGVALEGMLLKPNMVLSGASASNRASAQVVAEMTVDCFKRTIPAAMPGIVFLSGGQSDDEATVKR